MSRFGNHDRLELLGLLAGGFVVIVALGTLLEPPWATNESTGAAAVQTLGVVLSVVVGLILIGITSRGGFRGLVPGLGENGDE